MSDIQQAERPQRDSKPAAQARGWRLGHFGWLKEPPTAVTGFVYLVATLFGFAVLMLVGFGLLAAFQIAHEAAFGKFNDRIEAAKVFFPILLALVGGPLLIWRVITAHIQAQAARHQAETGREAHYTTLFTKAVEQLGTTREVKQIIGEGENRETLSQTEPNLEVRLGAIYALDRIARDSERDHWAIIEVLCAYVRNLANTGPAHTHPNNVLPGSRQFHAWLYALKPRVDVQAALTVIGQRPLPREALETGARLDFRGAALQRAGMQGGRFERATFVEAKLEGGMFFGAKLDGSIFSRADAAHCSFSQTSLVDAFFFDTHLEHAILRDADLRRAWFGEAWLTGASFDRANLAGASFQMARLREASFKEACLDGVDFFNTDLSQVKALDKGSLERAMGDTTTELPKGMERPASWPNHELSSEERHSWAGKLGVTLRYR